MDLLKNIQQEIYNFSFSKYILDAKSKKEDKKKQKKTRKKKSGNKTIYSI
jgi:hypothetical protein